MPKVVFFLFLLGQVSATAQSESTFDMKKELAKLSEASLRSDQVSMNAKGVFKKYEALVDHGEATLENRFKMGVFSLFSGDTENAISIFQALEKEAGVSGAARYFQALSYLYRAELDNCYSDHNVESCIIPFGSKAVHRNKNGSTMAIKILTEILENNPNNIKAAWLLNIAKETLGKESVFSELHSHKSSTVQFSEVGMQLGINNYGYYGGAIMEDLDNDGLLDVFCSSGELQTNVQLYKNNGDGLFSNMTTTSGLEGITGGVNLIHGDVNNDGLEDIYVIRGGWLGEYGRFHPNSLLINMGNMRFEDQTDQRQLLNFSASHTAVFSDFNNDGWLDLFVGNEEKESMMYMNDGSGNFVEEHASAYLNLNELVKASVVADFDGNGFPDIYVSVFKGDNKLYMNQGPDKNGQVKFVEEAGFRGVKSPWSSFATTLLDFNNDGHSDILCTQYTMNLAHYADAYLNHTTSYENKLFLNDGNGYFRDVSEKVGLNIPIEAMSINVGDVDNDGFEDVYFGTGWPDFDAQIPNVLLMNNAGERFEQAPTAGLSHLQKGHGIAFGDIDNDGDQDVFHSLGGFFEANQYWDALYLNSAHSTNNWLTLKMKGTRSNRSAIGTRVTINAVRDGEAIAIHRIVGLNGSYGSSSLQIEVGLGSVDSVLNVEVVWPTGQLSIYSNISLNRAYLLTEGSAKTHELDYQKILIDTAKSNEHHHHQN